MTRPESDEPLTVAAVQGFEDQSARDDDDSAARAAASRADKAFLTMRAALALRGFELHIVSDGAGSSAYLVQRWNMSRTLPDMGEVRAFAERAGVHTPEGRS